MIKITDTQVIGFDTAIRAMRNSYDSWDKSDSSYDIATGIFKLGDADRELMKKLIHGGDDHAKFMRMIVVYCDITAPRYWLTQLDTYKVGTVRCSCSTMHTITNKSFTADDFSCSDIRTKSVIGRIIEQLNNWRNDYKRSDTEEEKKLFWQCIIETLPQSYNQKSTVMLNYQVLRHMYKSRKHHKLKEWHEFCEWIEQLPYSELITNG